LTADERVGADAPDEDVAATAAAQHVVAGPAEQDRWTAAGVEAVVAVAAVQDCRDRDVARDGPLVVAAVHVHHDLAHLRQRERHERHADEEVRMDLEQAIALLVDVDVVVAVGADYPQAAVDDAGAGHEHGFPAGQRMRTILVHQGYADRPWAKDVAVD